MKLSALLREAGRDIASGSARFSLFAALLGLAMTTSAAVDATFILQTVDAADRFRSSGASILTVVAPGQVNGAACERFSAIRGVSAAGAMRESPEKLVFTLTPSAPVPTFDVTPGFPRVLSLRADSHAGLVLSGEAADSVGVAAGDVVATTDGELQVGSTFVYPADGRRPGFGYAAFVPGEGDSPFDECWVQAWPQVQNLRQVLLTAIYPGKFNAGHPPVIAQLNTSLGDELDANREFRDRIGRLAAPVNCLTAVGVGYAAIRSRRLQLASALHIGVRRADVISLALLETAAWAASAAIISMAVLVGIVRGEPSAERVAILANEAPVSLAGFVGAVIGAALAAAGCRERALFRYFRDR